MTSLVILDTTETFGNLGLDGPDIMLLRRYISRHPATLMIPKIVIDETINHFQEQLKQSLDDAKSKLRVLGRLAPHIVLNALLECDLQKEVKSFSDKLHKHLETLKIACPNYDGINLSSLVGRALSRRKPFDPKGAAGFRDALIWETILAYMTNKKLTEVVFITRNKRDFGEHGKLADDLADDLEALGKPRNFVTVCEGVQLFVNEKVKPQLQKLDDIERQINAGEFPDLDPMSYFTLYMDEIKDELSFSVKRLDLERLTSRYLWKFCNPTLGHLERIPDHFHVNDVWRVSTNELAIVIDFFVDGTISCEKVTALGPYGEPRMKDHDGEVAFTLMMSLIYNENTKEIVSWELDDLEVELTNDWGDRVY